MLEYPPAWKIAVIGTPLCLIMCGFVYLILNWTIGSQQDISIDTPFAVAGIVGLESVGYPTNTPLSTITPIPTRTPWPSKTLELTRANTPTVKVLYIVPTDRPTRTNRPSKTPRPTRTKTVTPDLIAIMRTDTMENLLAANWRARMKANAWTFAACILIIGIPLVIVLAIGFNVIDWGIAKLKRRLQVAPSFNVSNDYGLVHPKYPDALKRVEYLWIEKKKNLTEIVKDFEPDNDSGGGVTFYRVRRFLRNEGYIV